MIMVGKEPLGGRLHSVGGISETAPPDVQEKTGQRVWTRGNGKWGKAIKIYSDFSSKRLKGEEIRSSGKQQDNWLSTSRGVQCPERRCSKLGTSPCARRPGVLEGSFKLAWTIQSNTGPNPYRPLDRKGCAFLKNGVLKKKKKKNKEERLPVSRLKPGGRKGHHLSSVLREPKKAI